MSDETNAKSGDVLVLTPAQAQREICKQLHPDWDENSPSYRAALAFDPQCQWLAPLATSGAAWRLAEAMGEDFFHLTQINKGRWRVDWMHLSDMLHPKYTQREYGPEQASPEFAIAAAFLRRALGRAVRIEEPEAK